MTKQTDEEYFDIQTRQFLSYESDNEYWKKGQTRYLDKHFLNLNKDLKILDAACGDGVGLKWFQENDFQYVAGLEFSPEKILKAQRYGYPLIQEDLHNITLPPDEFDIVYSSHTLEHCHTPALAFRQIHRILKKNGRFYLVLPYPDEGDDRCHVGKTDLGTTIQDEAQTLVKFVEQFGFKVLSKEFDSFRQPEVWLVLEKL